MRPEVHAALMLAVRECNKGAYWASKQLKHRRMRKHQQKVQKHLARAVKYDSH